MKMFNWNGSPTEIDQTLKVENGKLYIWDHQLHFWVHGVQQNYTEMNINLFWNTNTQKQTEQLPLLLARFIIVADGNKNWGKVDS